MSSGINTAMNGFLAILENRPETARKLFAPPFNEGVTNFATITGRIEQARENVKVQAVRDAIREVYNETLKLRPPAVLGEGTSEWGLSEEQLEVIGSRIDEAYLEGVQAVEAVLARILERCDQTERRLGAQTAILP